jgi:hypothetical protein
LYRSLLTAAQPRSEFKQDINIWNVKTEHSTSKLELGEEQRRQHMQSNL